MKTLQKYIKATEKMVKKFVDKYYLDEEGYVSDYHLIGGRDRLHAGPVEINDMYWSLEDIYQALLHDVPEDVLFDWYDYKYNKEFRKSEGDDVVVYNLASWYLGEREYTQEEKENDERRIKEIEEDLYRLCFS